MGSSNRAVPSEVNSAVSNPEAGASRLRDNLTCESDSVLLNVVRREVARSCFSLSATLIGGSICRKMQAFSAALSVVGRRTSTDPSSMQTAPSPSGACVLSAVTVRTQVRGVSSSAFLSRGSVNTRNDLTLCKPGGSWIRIALGGTSCSLVQQTINPQTGSSRVSIGGAPHAHIWFKTGGMPVPLNMQGCSPDVPSHHSPAPMEAQRPRHIDKTTEGSADGRTRPSSRSASARTCQPRV